MDKYETDKYCLTCSIELIVAYSFCTIIKKKPMKTFFIYWKNGLEEILPGTSITNALVIARYDAAAIKVLDYYTIDDNPARWVYNKE